ncbi:hypothetical protein DOTSEDRAFT_73248 [Dothistroma septosporum NZE10]|uniref:Asl1-like glycosyl hydrolase catalytic domain-containing protein n=1 Tax=Dothistroma septosporum (strain NZE10 / CBS 128990) TaxID=675120 RepID=N1PLD0_DOTSN|nr:hypothetical protein DOTSEDRAFT_73248 [Dothistroma septosporum NZE10]
MSAITQLSILALATTVLAGQHKGYQHAHLHGRHHKLNTRPVGTGSGAPYAYPTANSTGIWGTTGYSSATSTASAMPTASYGSLGGNTYTISNIHTEVVYSTIQLSAADQCAAEVTVTNTEKVYVTVTAGQTASSSAEGSAVGSTYAASSYSSPAAQGAGSSISAAAYSAPAYSAQESSSSEASLVPASSAGSYSAPAYSSASSGSSTSLANTTMVAQYSSSPVPATSAAASYTSYTAASSQYTGSATTSAPASYSSSSSNFGKRGLVYNDASLISCFEGSSEISWAYNWVSTTSDLSDTVMYIPMLWGNTDTYTSSWSEDAKKGISNGATHLFSFNEPDQSGQSNIDYATAASAYKEYMNPLASQAKLCAPSVTNGGGQMGLTYLQNFLNACNSGDETCQIDCINIHWYDSATNIAYFKQHINDAKAIAGDKPIYVTEFGATGSDDEINTFLQEVMPWMDSDNQIAGYAYYMVSEGLLISGGEPTTYGSTYKSYTS